MNTTVKHIFIQARRIFLVCLAAVIFAVNIKTFVRSGNLFPGGYTGLTILVQHIFEKYFSLRIPFSPCILLLNAIPVAISFKAIGKHFALYSSIAIILSSVLVDIIPDITITQDVLLSSVFGGIIAAGAVVTKDVPARCMVAGVPAKVVKENVDWQH
ncbi:MAG: YitT family protein [Treponema sp.]|nr:YitT family protein [Treponema sp.]